MAPATGATAYVVNHVVLPPDLPQTNDYEVAHERHLLELVIHTLQDLKSQTIDGHDEPIKLAIATMRSLSHNRDGQGNVNEAILMESLDKLVASTDDMIIPLEIKSQNAGLLMCREGVNIVFESFELSPTNEAAMTCKGRLKRTFPGLSSRIPATVMQEGGLQQPLTSAIAKMSVYTAADFQPSNRADTIHPGLVTDYLMSVLAAVGEPVDRVRIIKHTRDEVLSKQAAQPWRRSPLWLLVRVTLQLVFNRRGGPQVNPDELYKAFIIQLLSRILALAKENWQELGGHSIRAISTKLIRRLHKFETMGKVDCLQPGWQDQVRRNLIDVHNLLDIDWKEAAESTQANINSADLLSLRPEEDLDTQLPKLDAYLLQVTAPTLNTTARHFKPNFEYPEYPADEIPNNLNKADENQIYRLAATEVWVERCLEAWVKKHKNDISSSGKIRRLMRVYHISASMMYAGNPTSTSVMYLTLCDMWMQCDILACHESPLLRKYDPEVHLDELQCLSLPLKSQMERLHDIESYVRSRRAAATKGNPSIYRDFGKASSFAVKYFLSSEGSSLQALLAEVQRAAGEKYQKKCKELGDLKCHYQDLIEQYNTKECEFEVAMTDDEDEDKVTTPQHSTTCCRCDLKRQANELEICIYEKPLSEEPSVAMATIFELKVPEAFSHWRDATYYLITAVLGIRNDTDRKPSCAVGLDKHHELSHMLSSQYNARRLVIVSTVKSHTAGSEPLNAISTLEETDVCLNSRLSYKYYDRERNVCIDGTRKSTAELSQTCSYVLPRQSKDLERYLYRLPSAPDGLPSNEVIADQARCPAHFSIDEFKAFCTIPLGCEIMYENILVQLAMPNMDFAKTETQCLMQHIVHQVGPWNGQVERTLHWILRDSDFCDSMLAQLEMTLRKISENWESWRALATFCLLARRILTLNTSEEVTQRSLKYLDDVREVCLRWLRTLEGRAMTSTNQEQRSELYLRTLDIALLGTTTFDIDARFFQGIFEQPGTASALLQFSIRIKENQESLKSNSDNICRIMHQSWIKLMYRILPALQKRILHASEEMNQAILVSWPTFQHASGARWTSSKEPQHQWLSTTSGTLSVQFDLLTGTLLVNGAPLTRLPDLFTQLEMYTRLFGKTILEVGPSSEPGMQFSAKSSRHGYKLHFGMCNDDMLLLAAKDKSRLEVLPSRLFDASLPQAFVSDYIHWYDRDKDEVVLRNQVNPWTACGAEWRLIRTGTTWRLVKEAEACINIASRSAHTLMHIFRPLEDTNHIHFTWSASSQALSILLPRLQVDFYITHHTDRIRSRQYRNMNVDFDQNIGTLVGLTSKLILRGEGNGERMVLIPLPRDFGTDSIKYVQNPTPDHVEVTIAKESSARICAYTLDTTLGRISDNGDLQGKLLLTYLHALTSHHLPDPFTACTGTEAALSILRSASTRSFETLSAENVSILTLIARLSPGRTLHAADVQQVHWNPGLPVLSQHPGFYSMVKSMFDEASKTLFLHPDSEFVEPKGLPAIKECLQKRDAIRCSTFRVDEFGAEGFTDQEDIDYVSRSTNGDPKKGQRAFIAATLILRGCAALHEPIPSLKAGLFKTHLSHAVMRSTNGPYDLDGLCFDIKWLGDSPSLLAEHWCSLHLSLPKASKKANRFNIMLWLSTMAYSTTVNMDAIHALAAFYRLKDMASVKPPTASVSFNLSRGDSWIAAEITDIADLSKRPISDCPEARIPVDEEAKKGVHARKVNGLCRKNQRDAAEKFTSALQKQWPRCKPTTPPAKEIKVYLDVSSAMHRVRGCFKAWHDNLRFKEYLDRVSAILARQKPVTIPVLQPMPSQPISTRKMSNTVRHYSMRDIFTSPPPVLAVISSEKSLFVGEDESPLAKVPSEPKVSLVEKSPGLEKGPARGVMRELCRDLGLRAVSKCEKEYVKTLRSSCSALENYDMVNKMRVAQITSETSALLHEHLMECKDHFKTLNLVLAQVVQGEAGSCREISLLIRHTPRISPMMWLKCLNREYFESLSEPWKAVIVEYGRAVTNLHRASRMAALSDKPIELAQEMQNAGHTNWCPREFPETLLLEAESGILVREVQEVIAAKMRNPPHNENAVCQLNMGEGKSSVIVPMLATTLADSTRLVRVVIAKPQSKQMLQVLISKLGGLLNRRVYHLPFSRELRLNASEAQVVRSICQECMENRGVILAQPEHILSFKLMSIETVLINQKDIASSLLGTQKFFDSHARDIVDESDENFSPRFELVYTMGSQEAIDFAPQRWIIIQQILQLVPKYALQVKEYLPVAVDIHYSSEESFPRVRTLRSDATAMLLRLIARHIVEYGLTGLSTRALSAEDEKTALETYILQPVLTLEQIQAVEASDFWTDLTKHAILLVRGIIACGILRFTLGSKRWRVNYGLDIDRTPGTLLAVPYRFKDGPNPRAEYSHPDVLILLTLLSHYYGGLNDEQMFIAFKHLSKSDQSDLQFNEWVSTAASSLPLAYRTLSGINLRDRQHCIEHVFPHLRYSKACIDYFLSRLVFPKEVKQFTSKLSASGWDMGAVKVNPTTGFSGTKDTMHLLPLAVKHLDLPSQSHTNALVLGHLLETSSVELLHPQIESTDAEHILSAVIKSKPEIRVVIDCGAAILEQSNKQVVKSWLEMTGAANIQAAVFFEEEELSVLDRTGRVESLQTSPFAKQLDVCVVYLDEAHSRGTDLRLPRHYRACLTLGLALSKDKLIQGCMRMRQLGKGQSVVFLVPEEIATKIYEITSNDFDDPITVRDVLVWSIQETWTDLKKSMPLWAVQGHRFLSREHIPHDANMTIEQAKQHLEDEGQDLESRYRPSILGNKLTSRAKQWDKNNPSTLQILERCESFGAIGLDSADLEEEQERELAPEQEEERMVERPERMEAASHVLHDHLHYLIKEGRIRQGSKQFTPAFQSLNSTSAAKLYNLLQFPTDLLVTADFVRTVKQSAITGKQPVFSDSFQRTVQWVLSVPDTKQPDIIQHLVILSPHEANQLLPQIRKSTKVTLHIFSPRTNSSYAPLDALNLYKAGRDFTSTAVPRSLTAQLNLFAGSLYLNTYEEYTELCDFLGLLHSSVKEGQQVSADGFIKPPAGKWKLRQSPVPLLRALLMRIRKEGEGLEKTHLGKILNGVRLEEADFRTDTEMSGT